MKVKQKRLLTNIIHNPLTPALKMQFPLVLVEIKNSNLVLKKMDLNNLQVFKPCNQKARQSSATRGVKSRLQLNMLHQVEAPYAPVNNQTIPLLSPVTEMKLMHADSWLPPTVPMNGGLPTPGVRPQSQNQLQQQQQQSAVVSLDELHPATLSPDGMEDYQDLSKFMPLHQPCDSLVGESIINVELKGMNFNFFTILFLKIHSYRASILLSYKPSLIILQE